MKPFQINAILACMITTELSEVFLRSSRENDLDLFCSNGYIGYLILNQFHHYEGLLDRQKIFIKMSPYNHPEIFINDIPVTQVHEILGYTNLYYQGKKISYKSENVLSIEGQAHDKTFSIFQDTYHRLVIKFK